MVADDPGVEASGGPGLPMGSAPGVPGLPGGVGVRGRGGSAPGSSGLLGVPDPEGPTPSLPGAHGGAGTGLSPGGTEVPVACRTFFEGGGPTMVSW